MSDEQKPSGPDLKAGVPLASIEDGGMLLGHVDGEPALLARRGDAVFAIGAVCTHYSGPLNEGLLVDESVRCPWHHACFSLRNGEALRAPALDPVTCWRVEQQRGTVYAREKIAPPRRQSPADAAPRSIVIVGGGAAGNAAAEMLRREGYEGSITMLSADADMPCDRPNLSKDFLAGGVGEEAVPLRSAEFYREHRINLRLNTRVEEIDTAAKRVRLADGSVCDYGALLLATGAEPVTLDVPGADLEHVHYLRSVADSRALLAKALASQRAVVIGASFIGLEVAASLRARGLAVDVVAPETVPMERVLGPEAGRFVQSLHEKHGVKFHLGTTAVSIDDRNVVLKDGSRLPADLVVVGIGVRPRVDLAEAAGIATDHGVTVDACLATSIPGIFAAGDIARWPDRHTGQPIRVEHWVVAERMGQAAARNMLGGHERFGDVPFFWTAQYDFTLSYVGHAEHWDRIETDGSLEAGDCSITYWANGRKLAEATVGRDLDGLSTEVAFEKELTV